MNIVMGELNGVRLFQIMLDAASKCSRVTAAVAYATPNNPFFKHCRENNLHLDFYGLLDKDEAVAIPLLETFLSDGPLVVNCRLVKGHFHSKIIWWHGYGAYIGSANLTHNAWFSNVETGVFFEESELFGEIGLHLEQQFQYLNDHSSPLSSELVRALKTGKSMREAVQRESNKASDQFDAATKDIPGHAGLTTVGPSLKTTAYTKFAAEWSQTLELLRGLRNEFIALGLRPKWVDADANSTVHFDQFLHAYYYVRVRGDRSDDEDSKSTTKVNRSFQQKWSNPRAALLDGAEWWSSLPESPYGEEEFIRVISKRMREEFSKARLADWTVDDFKATFSDVHAFKAHARQVKNAEFGLPPGYSESHDKRINRLSEWLWGKTFVEEHRTVKELLQFLIWGSAPENVAERLWIVTTFPEWKFSHFGPSSLGEAVGWARPDDYPPRNNRTNKALRALGHDVRLFSTS